MLDAYVPTEITLFKFVLTGIVVMCRDIEDYVSIIRKSCRNDVRNCGTLFKNL